MASEIAVSQKVTSDPVQVQDSTDVFRNITDISRQIEQRTTQSNEAQRMVDTPPIIIPQNKTLLWDDAPRDTIRPIAIPRDTVRFTSLHKHLFYRNPLDSIYTRKENGTLQLPLYNYNTEAMRGLTFRDTLLYNPLFLPVIFTGEMLPRDLSFYPLEENRDKGLLIPQEKTLASGLRHADFIRHVRRDYYLAYPDRIRYSVLNFEAIPRITTDDNVVRDTFNPFRDLIRTETTFSLDAPGVEGATIGRRYWVYAGEHSFQFAQNYFSTNWHKGGTNNLNFNSFHVIKANYQKDKIKFNNALEWRLSLFNAPDDSVRNYRIGNDLIRYYGDFGIDALLKGWSYSMNMEAKSQFFNNYPTNSSELRSAFLAPLYVNAGVGLKYNLDKKSEKVRHRRLQWNLALAPVSINYTYVGNDAVDVVRYGIPEGRNSLLDIGSTVTSILKFDFTRYITWDSRLTYFTSYEKVISEFENSLNMALSNAFSTRVYLNMRFDDGVPADPDLKYWQINQTLSFGLNYKW